MNNNGRPTADNRIVTWDELHRDARSLAARLLARAPFAGIVGIARGGLVPAAILARELGIRRVDTLCVAAYAGRRRGPPKVLKIPDEAAAARGRGWLVVDDLADTGTTLNVARELMPEAIFAALYAKPAGRSALDHFVAEIAQDIWVDFPWDTAPGYAPPLAGEEK